MVEACYKDWKFVLNFFGKPGKPWGWWQYVLLFVVIGAILLLLGYGLYSLVTNAGLFAVVNVGWGAKQPEEPDKPKPIPKRKKKKP